MLLAVVLAAALTYYAAAPNDVTRKEALDPSRSQDVMAAGKKWSSVPTRQFVGDLLEKNNYTLRLYGEGRRPVANWHEWLGGLTIIFNGLLDEESQQALADRTMEREDMCPRELAASQGPDEKGCWTSVYHEGTGIYYREMRKGVHRVGADELVNIGAEGLTWITSDHGHLAAGSGTWGHNPSIPSYANIEVLHCATSHEEDHAGQDAAWFYAVPGSGVSANVGRTIVVSEFELEKVGISAPMQSMQLAMFWVDVESNLTQHLGLSFGERNQIDTIQRVDHHELGALPAYHEIIMNPKYLKEHERMFQARHDVIQCGADPLLHSCKRNVATAAQLAIVANVCSSPTLPKKPDDLPDATLLDFRGMMAEAMAEAESSESESQ